MKKLINTLKRATLISTVIDNMPDYRKYNYVSVECLINSLTLGFLHNVRSFNELKYKLKLDKIKYNVGIDSIRRFIKNTDSKYFEPLLDNTFKMVKSRRHIPTIDSLRVIAVDGSQFTNSSKCKCDQCSETADGPNKKQRFYHKLSCVYTVGGKFNFFIDFKLIKSKRVSFLHLVGY